MILHIAAPTISSTQNLKGVPYAKVPMVNFIAVYLAAVRLGVTAQLRTDKFLPIMFPRAQTACSQTF